MHYKQIVPPKNLSPYIRCFGILESDTLYNQTRTFNVIPDACPGLLFQQNPGGFLVDNEKPLPQLFLYGMNTKPFQKTLKGYCYNLAVFFQPTALRSIFGIDAHELTNQCVDLNAILKNDLTDQLLAETSATTQIAILSSFVEQKRKYNQKIKCTLSPYIEQIEHKAAELTVRGIQSCLGVSERSLERLFSSHVGIAPKLFFRINRFQRALDTVRRQPFSSSVDIAYQHHYADQSHYIREFREFSGVTPKQFIQQAEETVVNFPEWQS